MRPNRSVDTPPTKPVGAPSRAMPTAMLRQDPPTTGTRASRPSADLAGRKSISASPQLNSISPLSSLPRGGLHDQPALAVDLAQQGVHLALGGVEVGHRRGRGSRQRAQPRHRLDRGVKAE